MDFSFFFLFEKDYFQIKRIFTFAFNLGEQIFLNVFEFNPLLNTAIRI